MQNRELEKNVCWQRNNEDISNINDMIDIKNALRWMGCQFWEMLQKLSPHVNGFNKTIYSLDNHVPWPMEILAFIELILLDGLLLLLFCYVVVVVAVIVVVVVVVITISYIVYFTIYFPQIFIIYNSEWLGTNNHLSLSVRLSCEEA